MFSGLPHAIVYDMEVSKTDVVYAATNHGSESAREIRATDTAEGAGRS